MLARDRALHRLEPLAPLEPLEQHGEILVSSRGIDLGLDRDLQRLGAPIGLLQSLGKREQYIAIVGRKVHGLLELDQSSRYISTLT